MSVYDSILSQISSNVDIANLGAKVGLDPDMVEKAVAALGVAHQQPGDTVENAAAQTGIDAGVMSQIVAHIGGDSSLGEFSRLLQEHPQAQSLFGVLDRDGDGNPLNDITGMAKGLFGGN